MNNQEIAAAFKNARHDARLTCKQVAAVLGNSEKTVSGWENGIGKPDIGTLFKLCDIYGLSGLNELLGRTTANDDFSGLKVDERDLIQTYRQLTTNSKQIVSTVAQLELKHVHAVQQGETPIRVMKKTKAQADSDIQKRIKTEADSERFLRVFNQSAAAGYGDFIDDDSFETVAVPSIPEGTEFGVRISGDSMQPLVNSGDIVFVKRQSGVEVGDIGIFIYNGDAYCKKLIYKDGTYYLHSLNKKYRDIAILTDSIYSVGKVLDHYNQNTD